MSSAPTAVPEKDRVCASSSGRSYCGRRKSKRAAKWAAVTCPDCRAAYRADGGHLS